MAKKRKTLAGASLELREIEPLTRNQLTAFESEKNLVLHGLAGTGKTFISSYLAYDDMAKGKYQNLVIIRSAVPTRDIGFLPGTEILKNKSLVHFMTTSFIRGITLRDAVILIDECQNMSFHELDSIITRMGENCRIMFCGDFRQADLKANGLQDFIRVLKRMERFTFIDFQVEDIVRSEFVKDYIIAKNELNL